MNERAGPPAPVTLTSEQRAIVLLSLALVNFVYFLSSSYIGNSNEGSHFALVSALVEDRSIEISRYVQYTEWVDYAPKDGRLYSDRMPGTAMLTVPVYGVAKLLRDGGVAHHLSRHPNIGEVFVVVLPNAAGTLAVFLMFRLGVALGLDVAVSLSTAVLFAFTTLIWREASHLFAHAPSVAAMLGATYLTVTADSSSARHARRAAGVAALLALAALIEQINVLHAIPFLVYAVASGKLMPRVSGGSGRLRWLTTLAAVYLSIYGILPLYTFAAFGELTLRPAKYNPNFPEHSLAAVLSGNPLHGLDTVLTNFTNPERIRHWAAGTGNATPGLFVVSPLLLLSLAGFREFARTRPHEAVLFASVAAIQIGAVAFNHNPQTRHVVTALPFLFFPLAYVVRGALGRIRARGEGIVGRYGLLALIVALSGYSAARVFHSIQTFYGRSWASPFVFAGELRAYVFFYAPIVLGYGAYVVVSRRRRPVRSPP